MSLTSMVVVAVFVGVFLFAFFVVDRFLDR